MTNEGDVAPETAGDPLAVWSGWTFLAAVLALALGTILAILGVNTAGLLLPGVYILELALLLLAATGILRALRP